MGTYSVIVTCRNSEKDIESAVSSIIYQSIKPEYIIVVDDGSKDNTPSILKGIQSRNDNVHVLTNPDLGYNIGRVVENWNKALRYINQLNLVKTDYHMIGTDDTEYEKEYCEKIMKFMDLDSLIAVASGNYDNKSYSSPHGAGRFIRNSFFTLACGQYPEKMGYETAIIHIASQKGLKYRVIPEAKFIHTRELGSAHHFYEFGASMRTLGYHPIFAFGRFIKYLATGKPIGRLGSIYMIYHYLSYKPKEEGYDSMYDPQLRESIRNIQLARIKEYVGFRQSKSQMASRK